MQLNKELKAWLHSHKITDQVIEDFNIHGDAHLVIPVYDIDGNFSFNKYRRNPAIDTGTKYWYDKGGKVTLFGMFKAKDYKKILITEGEKDCLVAWSHNIPAVTSTGGALSFQEDWVELFKDKEVVICLDNDSTGGDGMAKILEFLPDAKVVILPQRYEIKDISDYVMSGNDLRQILKTARGYTSIEDVQEDMDSKNALKQQPTYFHEAYIKAHTKVVPKDILRPKFDQDPITNAKAYPIVNLLEFKGKKTICPFHNEKTPSMHYNADTNTAFCFGACQKPYDSINVYMEMYGCTFSEAVKELNKM